MYMFMFVLDDPEKLDDLLEAWEDIGIDGATIIESTGLNRRRIAKQVGSGFMAGMNRLMASEQVGHYTLFLIIPDLETAQQCLAAAEKITGDLATPNTGVLAVWPLAMVKGVPPSHKAGMG